MNFEKTIGVDYQVVYVASHTTAFKIPTLEPDLLGFVKPYTIYSWAVIGCSLLLMAVIWIVIKNIFAILGKVTVIKENFEYLKDYSDALFSFLRTMLMQDLTSNVMNINKIILGTWMLMSVIICSMYKSNLKALLITPRLPLPFDSLEELVQTDIPLAVAKGSAVYSAFLNAESNTTLGKAMERNVILFDVINFTSAIVNVVEGNYAFTSLSTSIQFASKLNSQETGSCNAFLTPVEYMPLNLAMIYRRGAPFNKKLMEAFSSLVESGILGKLIDESVTDTGSKCKIERPNERPLSIEDFLGVFILYASTLSLATLCFICEVVYGYISPKT